MRCLGLQCWMSSINCGRALGRGHRSLGRGHTSQSIAADSVAEVLAGTGSCVPTPTNHTVCFALTLQVLHKDKFGSLISSLSTVPFPDLTGHWGRPKF